MRPSRSAPLILGLAALAVLPGCGPPPAAEVSGTIKLNGQPPGFNGLEVVFMGEDGKQAAGRVAEDGTYRAQGVPAGEVKVGFAYATPEAARMGAEAQAGGGRKLVKPGAKKDAPTPQPKLTGKEPPTSPVPTDLRDPSTSKLTCKVEPGKPNTFDYDIPAAKR